MSKILVLILSFSVILSSSIPSQASTLTHPPIPTESPNTEKIAIVMLDQAQDPQRILAKFPELKLRHVFEHALTGFSVKGPAHELARLAKQANIKTVSPVATYRVEEPLSTEFRIPFDDEQVHQSAAKSTIIDTLKSDKASTTDRKAETPNKASTTDREAETPNKDHETGVRPISPIKIEPIYPINPGKPNRHSKPELVHNQKSEPLAPNEKRKLDGQYKQDNSRKPRPKLMSQSNQGQKSKLMSQSNQGQKSKLMSQSNQELKSKLRQATQAHPNSNGNLTIIGVDQIRGMFDEKDRRLTGKGVTVGVIDTGIDYTHPDLKANYIGGRDFVDDDKDPMETKGRHGHGTLHGTHVSGIIAANGKITGVAPEAKLVAYRALGPGGSGTTEQVIAAIEQAIKDKVDIINLSLGNSVNGPDLPISQALNRAVDKGITAVTSSGNSGPKRWSVGSPGTASKAISVGASTPTLKIPYLLVAGDEKIRIQPMQGSMDWSKKISSQPTEIVFAGIGRPKDLKDVKGKIALVKRGKLTFTKKAKNAADAGAKAIIIANNTKGNFNGSLEQLIPIPVSSMSKQDAERLKILKTTTVRTIYIEEKDQLADFSSRGPVTVTWEIKPDVIAPGVAINSTIPGGYLALQGTSMAAPHVTGACALIKQAHPDWTPKQIKAALMNTAKTIVDHDGKTYKTFEQGAGRIQPLEAIKAETLVTPGSIQYGKFQLDENHHKHSGFVTVKNLGSTKKSYYFSLPKKAEGIDWQFPLSFSLKANEEKKLPISLSIKPDYFSKKIYDGHLELNEGSNKIRIPYLYVFEEPDYPRVMGFEFEDGDHEGSYRYEVYLPGGAEEFGIAVFNPNNYQFIGFLDTQTNVGNGTLEKEIQQDALPSPGLYLVKVFAKKGDKEDMIETMIEINREADD